jgi:hypothetical protein
LLNKIQKPSVDTMDCLVHTYDLRLGNELVLSQKCLGVDLDNRLIFDIDIENLCKKICSGIGALRRITDKLREAFLF